MQPSSIRAAIRGAARGAARALTGRSEVADYQPLDTALGDLIQKQYGFLFGSGSHSIRSSGFGRAVPTHANAFARILSVAVKVEIVQIFVPGVYFVAEQPDV